MPKNIIKKRLLHCFGLVLLFSLAMVQCGKKTNKVDKVYRATQQDPNSKDEPRVEDVFSEDLFDVFLQGIYEDFKAEDLNLSVFILQEKKYQWTKESYKEFVSSLKSCFDKSSVEDSQNVAEFVPAFSLCALTSLVSTRSDLDNQEQQSFAADFLASYIKTIFTRLPEKYLEEKSGGEKIVKHLLRALPFAYKNSSLNQQDFLQNIGFAAKKGVESWSSYVPDAIEDLTHSLVSSVFEGSSTAEELPDYAALLETIHENISSSFSKGSLQKLSDKQKQSALARIAAGGAQGIFMTNNKHSSQDRLNYLQKITEKSTSLLLKSPYGQKLILDSFDNIMQIGANPKARLEKMQQQEFELKALESTTASLIRAGSEPAKKILYAVLDKRLASVKQKSNWGKAEKTAHSKKLYERSLTSIANNLQQPEESKKTMIELLENLKQIISSLSEEDAADLDYQQVLDAGSNKVLVHVATVSPDKISETIEFLVALVNCNELSSIDCQQIKDRLLAVIKDSLSSAKLALEGEVCEGSTLNWHHRKCAEGLHCIKTSSNSKAYGICKKLSCVVGNSSSCDSDFFCEAKVKSCSNSSDKLGLCEKKPDICTEHWSPVCGCNDITYGNDCKRQSQGVSKKHDGKCESTVIDVKCKITGCSKQICAATETNSDCEYKPEYQCYKYAKCQYLETSKACAWDTSADSYASCIDKFTCSLDEQRIAADGCNTCKCTSAGSWACTKMSCPEKDLCKEFRPPCQSDKQCAMGESCEKLRGCNPSHCHCDKNTGKIFCTRDCAGGACVKKSQSCGGISGHSCNSSKELCEYPVGSCNTADLQGRCSVLPDYCPAYYKPVCGCDGKTYANDCLRKKSRIVKKQDGPCKN